MKSQKVKPEYALEQLLIFISEAFGSRTKAEDFMAKQLIDLHKIIKKGCDDIRKASAEMKGE